MGCLCGAGERSPSPPWSYFDSLCGATWKTLDTPVCTLWWPEGCERCTMVPPGGPPVQEHDYRPQIGSLYQIILPPASASSPSFFPEILLAPMAFPPLMAELEASPKGVPA
ncbi:uncharacterized protein RBU33_028384 isoform 1-T2 [Hipposideros larvatus]